MTPVSAFAATVLRAAAALDADPAWAARIAAHGPALVEALHAVYGARPEAWWQGLFASLLERHRSRPEALRALDADRPSDWVAAPMLGYSAYVDRFGGTLRGLLSRIDHLARLGVGYLHLLPFLAMREGDSDGGFAVRDYGAVEPSLGTMDDLEALASALRAKGISLCADLVLNHCADDHAWARAARAGDAYYRDFFHVLPDWDSARRHEATLGQVFPGTAPGNFTDVPGLGIVWTTFYPFQWDLNWSNPEVFKALGLALLDLANRGVEAFRLDSTGYLWKREGTPSMNLPEAHRLLQALRAMTSLVAPSVALKAEAIVPMRELPPYFGTSTAPECHIAYQASLMAAAWASLALGRADIAANVLQRTPAIPEDAAWLHYVRCHDDIGWGVLDAEAAGQCGIPPFDLSAVSRWWSGEAAGSPSRGAAFQSEDGRAHGTNGMAAALLGLDAAREADDPEAIDRALRRIELLYGLAMALPGIALVYMGDELGQGNDTGWRDDPARRHEGRWMQRPMFDLAAEALAGDASTIPGRLTRFIRERAAWRRERPELANRSVDARAEGPLLVLRRGDGFVGWFHFGETMLQATLPAGRWRSLDDGAVHESGDAVPLEPAGQRWWVRA